MVLPISRIDIDINLVESIISQYLLTYELITINPPLCPITWYVHHTPTTCREL